VHYYKKNIGDYHKKAGRLGMLQHGAYGLLLDACYDRESFPTLEQAIDWTWATSDTEVAAVKFVLKKFFSEDENGVFIQSRIDQELQEYRGQCQTNTINGKKGGRPKKITESVNLETESVNLETEPQPNETEPKANESLTTNHKPLTTNHKPITIVQKTRPRFTRPTVEEIRNYCIERQNTIDPESFFAHYETNGWVQGKGKPVKNWKMAIITWEKNHEKRQLNPGQHQNTRGLSKPEQVRAAREAGQR